MDSFKRCVSALVLRCGLALNIVEIPEFRQLVKACKGLPEGMPVNIGRRRLVKTILRDFDDHWRRFFDDIKAEDCESWSLVFDGWDWGKSRKTLGATAVVVRRVVGGLAQTKYPLFFRLLGGTPVFNDEEEAYETITTLSSAKDMYKVIIQGLEQRAAALDVPLSFMRFIGAKSYGMREKA